MKKLEFSSDIVICPCSIHGGLLDGGLLWDKLWGELLAAEELQESHRKYIFSCLDCRETYRMPIPFSEIL